MKTAEEILDELISNRNKHGQYDFVMLTSDVKDIAIQAMHDYASTRSMESQWIDVKERLPENEDTVLISNINTQSLTTTAIHIDGKFFMLELQQIADEVTHWMPLPQPPTK